MADQGYEHSEFKPEQRKGNGNGHSSGRYVPDILSAKQFTDLFRGPEYVWDSILQRGYFYSLTAHPGRAKTAVCLLLAAGVALGLTIAGKPLVRSRALYLAGENDVDVQMRWIAMQQHFAFSDNIEVWFMPGAYALKDGMAKVHEWAQDVGGAGLIIVDTSPAYFQGDEENSAAQLGAHARDIRSFTQLPGRPCVIACCHPSKYATDEQLIPRGTSAYLAEVDGNLTCTLEDPVIELGWSGKLRGPGFEAVSLELKTMTTPRLVDAKGREMWTVIAKDMSDSERRAQEDDKRSDDDLVLKAYADNSDCSMVDIANRFGWVFSDGSPAKSRVQRAVSRLTGFKFLKRAGRGYEVDKNGRNYMKKLKKEGNAQGKWGYSDE